jgi:outer membrane protein assembly factor BamB
MPSARGRRRALPPLIAFVLLAGVLTIGIVPAQAVAPTITSFTPAKGGVNTAVAITGTDFVNVTAVKFNGVTTTFGVASTTRINTVVPALATTGKISVTASGLTSTSVTNFTVTLGLGLSVAFGPPTTNLLVKGSGFGANEPVDLYFDTVDLALVSADDNGNFANANLQVPASATPGNHTITAIGRRTLSSFQTAFLVRTDWAQFRNGAKHRGRNPLENVLSPANVGQIDLDWSYTTGGGVFSSPAVANGVVYVGSYDGKLYALDATTGALKWSYATSGIVFSSPAVANGIVYFGSDDGKLYALNATSGALLWSYATGGAIRESSPTVANGVVYVGSYDSKIYALNATTGALKWSYLTGGGFASSPAVANGVVYAGSTDNKLYALNATTGALKWSYTTGGQIGRSSPAIANGVAYVGSYDSKLYALNATTGALKWSYTTGGLIPSSPAVANGVVYVGSHDYNLYALNASTGALQWSYPTKAQIDMSSPAVANGVVYIGSVDGSLYALPTGGVPWSYATGGRIFSSPAVANGVVYVGSYEDKAVHAFDLGGGAATAPAHINPAVLQPDHSLKIQR